METITTHKLRLYNDDIHDFLYIVASLIRYCRHEPLQAEQCALIAHDKGYCDIKSGDFLEMFEIKNNLEELDIKTDIVEHESNLYKRQK